MIDDKLLENTTMDTSISKRNCVKIYHQQGAHLNNQNQGFDFFFRRKLTTITREVEDILVLI